MHKKRRSRRHRFPSEKSALDFLDHLKRRNRSPRTIETYSSNLGLFEGWLGKDILKVSGADLSDYQQWLASDDNHIGKALSANTLSTHTGTLRSFYQWAVKERLVLKDPSTGLKYPKVRKRIHRDILTPKQLVKLITRPDNVQDILILRLLSLSGLRATELCSLETSDINIREREITIHKGKGNKDRITFMDLETRNIMSRFVKKKELDKPLFLFADRRKYIKNDVNKVVKKWANKCQLNKHITPHSLRRTYCTLMLQAGCNIKAIAELVGHSSLSTTSKYAVVDIKELSRIYNQSHPRA